MHLSCQGLDLPHFSIRLEDAHAVQRDALTLMHPMNRVLCSFAVVLLALLLGACGSPKGGGAARSAQASSVDGSVGRNLATLDAYCWRIELNKNTDYTVSAAATGGGMADASVHVQGKSWPEVLQKAVTSLEAAMAAKGITPAAAMAKQGSKTFSEAEIETLRSRYADIDGKAWYVKGTKSSGWVIQCKADVGQVSGVNVSSEGATLMDALSQAVTKLEVEIAKRKSAR